MPAGHSDLAFSLNWLADLHLSRDDLAAAAAARREALKILQKHYGETHWKVTDVRLALEDIEHRANMNDENKRDLTEANRLVGEVNALLSAGKNREAIAHGASTRIRTKEKSTRGAP